MGSTMGKEKEQEKKGNGGIMVGVRMEIVKEIGKIETGTEGLMVERVRREEKRWRIMGVCVGKGEIGRMLRELEK